MGETTPGPSEEGSIQESARNFVPLLGGARGGFGYWKGIRGIARLHNHAFVTEQRAEIRVSQNGGDVRPLAVEQHGLRHEPDAVAVVHPRRRVTEIKRLDRYAVGSMPAVDGDFVRQAGELGGDDHVLLVSADERAERVRFQSAHALRADEVVVLREDENGGHRWPGRK